MFNRLIMPALGLSRPTKRLIVFALDACLCIFTVWVAYFLRLGHVVPLHGEPLIAVALSILLAPPIFFACGLYRVIFRYSGWPALLTVLKACLIYGLLYACIIVAVEFQGIPRTLGFIQPILLFLCIGFSRALANYWLGNSYRQQLKLGSVPRVFIYGAGSSGRQLAAALRNSNQMHVVGFIDDNKDLHGQVLNNIPIYASTEIGKIASAFKVRDVLLALPSISRIRRNSILNRIGKYNLAVRTLPSFTDLAKGKISASDIKELDIEDLLSREPVVLDDKLLRSNIFGKVVLVTGAGGSIGSELCRQILRKSPTKLILLDHNEFSLYSIENELRSKTEVTITAQIIPILCSVCNKEQVSYLINLHKPNIIFHAAAYKHVPLVEVNPFEGIQNNVFGTLVMAQAAQKFGVSRFVLISTDKAVRPTNIMGASKRLAEMLLQALAQNYKNEDNTIFSIVRFGNVLDSSGSVVPLFRKQIQNGGPITLTHADVTRYFMLISEAAQLVIQAATMSQGGEVFLLDMGKPVKIAELARRMIELSGLQVRDKNNPEGDIEITITGLRPGEKLYEELLISNKAKPTAHPQIFMAHEEFISLYELNIKITELEEILNEYSVNKLRAFLSTNVTGFVDSLSKNNSVAIR